MSCQPPGHDRTALRIGSVIAGHLAPQTEFELVGSVTITTGVIIAHYTRR